MFIISPRIILAQAPGDTDFRGVKHKYIIGFDLGIVETTDDGNITTSPGCWFWNG